MNSLSDADFARCFAVCMEVENEDGKEKVVVTKSTLRFFNNGKINKLSCIVRLLRCQIGEKLILEISTCEKEGWTKSTIYLGKVFSFTPNFYSEH